MLSRVVRTQVTRNPAALMAASQPSESSQEMDVSAVGMMFSVVLGGRGDVRPRSRGHRGRGRRSRPEVRRASGGPVGGGGALFDSCLPVGDGLVDPAQPEQVVGAQA